MKAAIIGLGAVGEACAHLLTSRETVRSLVLANRTSNTALAIRKDLEQSRAWSSPLSAQAAKPWDHGIFLGSDVIVLTAGPRLRGHESRGDKAEATARLLIGRGNESILKALTRHLEEEETAKLVERERSILLVVSNPVEATVTWLKEVTGWPKQRIMGLGTTVETARFSHFLAEDMRVDPNSAWTLVIGEHGPAIALLDKEAVQRRIEASGRIIDIERLLIRTKNVASDIRAISERTSQEEAEQITRALEKKIPTGTMTAEVRQWLVQELSGAVALPATRYAIASSVVAVIEAIRDDRARVLPVSSFPNFEGCGDVAMALPFVIGRAGIIGCAYRKPEAWLLKLAQSVREQVEQMRTVQKDTH